MLTEEQLSWRLKYICGSDAPIVCGQSKWTTPIQLWKIKSGLTVQEKVESQHTFAGSYLEEGVGRLFEHHAGKKIIKDNCEMLVSKEYEFMGANIDGRIKGENAIIEIKTAASNWDDAWGETGSQKIPKNYMLQVAHYMHVADVEKCYVAVLIGGYDFRWYCIPRNRKLETVLVEKEQEFWNCVQNGIPPQIKSADDYIELNGTISLDAEISATDELEETLENLAKLTKKQKEIDEEIKNLTDTVKLYMKDREKLLTQTGAVAATYKETASPKRFDSKRFELDNPEIYEKYVFYSKPSRRFILKINNIAGE